MQTGAVIFCASATSVITEDSASPVEWDRGKFFRTVFSIRIFAGVDPKLSFSNIARTGKYRFSVCNDVSQWPP